MNESDPTSPTTGRARPIPIALLPWECAALSEQFELPVKEALQLCDITDGQLSCF